MSGEHDSLLITVLIIRTIIALMMDEVRTSETSVYFYETTTHNIPES
jgi:hypothetical protein